MLGLLRDVVLLNNNQQRRPTGFPELLTTQQQTGGDTNSNPDGFSPSCSQTYSLSYTTDDHNDGAGCIKLLNTYAGTNTFTMHLEHATGDLYWPVTPNAGYTLKGNVKSDIGGANDCRARISWYNSSKGFISNSEGTLTNSPTSWTEKNVTATAPANAAYAKLQILATKPLNHYMYYDTLSFKRTA